MKHIVIDLEMNSIDKIYREERSMCGMEIIEIGAVVLDDVYQEIGSFKTFVKPQYNDIIAPKYARLTGITTDMVANAPVFEDALHMFLSWCNSMNDEVEILQWSNSDLEQLSKEIRLKGITLNADDSCLLNNWSDFQKEYGDKLTIERSLSLKNAVELAGMDFIGAEHDALYDAKNTAELIKVVRDPALCKNALDHIIEALNPKPLCSTLGDLFNFSELFANA